VVLGDVIDIGEPLRQFLSALAALSVGTQAQPVQTVNIAARTLPTAGVAGFRDALLQLAPLQASMFAAQALREAGATSPSALARLDAGVADPDEDDLYAAMDWLLARQDTIQAKLAARHLSAGGLVLYDLSSSYFEGTTCPLARRGYSRDDKPGTLQVNYGLLTDARGCRMALSVFEGNTARPPQRPVQALQRNSVTNKTSTPRPRLTATQVRICAKAAPPAVQSAAATKRPSRLYRTKRMCMKIATIAMPSTDMMVHAIGISKLPPDCTNCLATRPSIHTPLASVNNEATSTAPKKRPSTSCMNRKRTGGSSWSTAGRRKKWVKTMPPIHTMMDST